MNVNHGLISGTRQPFPVVVDPFVLGIKTLQNHRLVLLDTPGFDDTFRDDMTILKEIADWLAQSSVILNFFTFKEMSHFLLKVSHEDDTRWDSLLTRHDSRPPQWVSSQEPRYVFSHVW